MAWTWSKEGPGGGALTVVVRVTHPHKRRPANGSKYFIFMVKFTSIEVATQTIARPRHRPQLGSKHSGPSFLALFTSLETRLQAMSPAG
jgi:hypothetical protein